MRPSLHGPGPSQSKAASTQPVLPEEQLPTLEQVFAEISERPPTFVPEVPKGQEDGPRMPDFRGLSYRQVLQVMAEKQLNLNFRGRGQVVEQSPRPGEGISYGAPAWVRLAPPG